MAGESYTTKRILLKKADGETVQYYEPYVRKATTEREGLVQPDGTTITINNGVISATASSSITVDSELSSTSENPVQNKVINSALSGKASSSHTHATTDITDFPTIPTISDTYDGTSSNGMSGKAVKSAIDSITDNDTKNTAGATDTSSKIYVIGATAQDANPQTYSHDTVYVDTQGMLNSANPASNANGTKVATTKWVNDKGYLTEVTSHNQASSTINALTGYNKGAEGGTGALDTDDTLNQALAKIENALDGKQASGSYASASHTHTKSEITDFPTIPTVNNTEIEIQKNGTKVDSFTVNQSGSKKTINISVPTQASDISAASATHTHASSDITAMTSYSKASSASAISTSDSLNTAIGKLEKALDGKQASGSYASASHTHTSSEITDFPTIPTITDTYDGTSSNGMSGKAVKSAIDSAISSVYKPSGSIAFTNRPTLAKGVLGNVYNITDAFTTTSDFVEGANKSYPAGTNIVVVNTGTAASPVYKFDVLAGSIDLSGYASSTHTHVGTDVTLTGYSKASSASAVVATDSVNTAIGKLEKALDGKQASGSYASADHTHSQYLTSVSWNDISSKPDSFTPSAHNQASSTINAMTGYSKASSASAISTSDSLNTAIGKLEKALDGKQASGSYATTSDISDMATKTWVGNQGYTTNTGTVTSVNNVSPVNGNVTLSIPSEVTSTTVSGWGFTKNAGTVTSVNSTSPDANGNVSITIPTVPTKLSSFTDDLGTSPTHSHSQYLTSVTAHNQASSTVNALTGYSKSVSGGTGALATTDTLNKALAKLENALDGKQASGSYLTASSSLDASKLTGTVPSGCYTDTVYTHPTTAGNKHIPSGGSSGKILKWSADGTATWETEYSYTHPTTAGNKHIPSGGSSNQVLVYSSSGTATWGAVPTHTHSDYLTSSSTLDASKLSGTIPSGCYTNTTYSNFVKSGTGAAAGLVPAPSTTAGTTKYLCEDGTWATPAGTYSHPTTAGYKHIPSGGSSNQVLVYSASGTATWGAVPTHTHSGYASSTHSHVGSEVTLTGYAKASSASAVATTDTLNVALGKLEYKLDDVDTQLQALVTTLNNAS